jgi:hypothetical protein
MNLESDFTGAMQSYKVWCDRLSALSGKRKGFRFKRVNCMFCVTIGLQALLAVLCVSVLHTHAEDATRGKPSANVLSLKLEIQNAIDRGLAWIQTNQNEKGYWSNPEHPALTGLALVALQGDPEKSNRSKSARQRTVGRGYEYGWRDICG